jgi:putative oxidoreductase
MADAIALIGRFLLGAIFVWSGFGKIGSPADTIQFIAGAGLPMSDGAYLVAVLIEVGGGFALLLGWQVRAAATVLAVFALVTAAAFHAHVADHTTAIQFMKNLAIAGGLLQVAAFGAGAFSLDALLDGRRELRRVTRRAA